MQLVETTKALDETVAVLADAPRIYLDTEFESSRQGTRLCLVQLSAGEDVHVIDALRVRDLTPLRPVLGRGNCEWVFHAGAQDVQLLLDQVQLEAPPRLFDTQVAWALVGPEYSVSLVYLLYRALGLRAPKAHQADDWKRRPLPRTQLEYAAADVEHLPALREVLLERLRGLGREQAVDAATRELISPPGESPLPLRLSSFRNAWQLDEHSQAGLRYLLSWYNALDDSQRRQAPDAKVLLSIAKRMPESGEELERIKGVPRQFARRHGDALAGALVRASAEADAADFVPIDPPAYATFPELQLDAWLGVVRAETCVRARIAPELAFPGRLTKRVRADLMAQGSPRPLIEALTGWRHDVLQDALVASCDRYPIPSLTD
jgi:ribonuclease D